MAERPRIVVIFTGGTIAMLPDPRTGAAVPSLDGAAILSRVPGLAAIAVLEPIDWGLVPASHLRFSQIIEIGQIIERESARPDVDGIVVVQGTDVLEETAYAWDLMHRSPVPVVVVGAMRNAGEADYEGPANLTDAVRAAAHPQLRDTGVNVVMAGRILPADDVTKTDSQALTTFQALNDGPLGRVADGLVRIDRPRGARGVLPTVPTAGADVVLLTAVVSTDGDLIRAAVDRGAAGIVVEATGSGNTDPDLLVAAIEAMEQGLAVALATRCPSGPVGPFYGFPGGGRSWQEAGVVMAGTRSGPKTRVALALGLGVDLDPSGLARLLNPGHA